MRARPAQHLANLLADKLRTRTRACFVFRFSVRAVRLVFCVCVNRRNKVPLQFRCEPAPPSPHDESEEHLVYHRISHACRAVSLGMEFPSVKLHRHNPHSVTRQSVSQTYRIVRFLTERRMYE